MAKNSLLVRREELTDKFREGFYPGSFFEYLVNNRRDNFSDILPKNTPRSVLANYFRIFYFLKMNREFFRHIANRREKSYRMRGILTGNPFGDESFSFRFNVEVQRAARICSIYYGKSSRLLEKCFWYVQNKVDQKAVV